MSSVYFRRTTTRLKDDSDLVYVVEYVRGRKRGQRYDGRVYSSPGPARARITSTGNGLKNQLEQIEYRLVPTGRSTRKP